MVDLPTGVQVLERGWLSSNCVVLQGRGQCALIDSGYVTHAPQTLALLQSVLRGRPLDLLLNTHLHSDHCGGNAALQGAYAQLQTHIPPGLAAHVRSWNAEALSYTPTGQDCPAFRYDAVLQPGSEILLGERSWQVHAAPGHDPHSIILFEPASRTLVSADALWEYGFGVVFPELKGASGFAEVAQTLDLIESLRPALVIPGHGSPFADAAAALARARRRLDGFVASPQQHLLYAAKVLLKFRLLQAQSIERAALLQWALTTGHFAAMLARGFPAQDAAEAFDGLLQALVQSGAARVDGPLVYNVG